MAFGDRIRLANAAGLYARKGILGYAIDYQEWMDFYKAMSCEKLRQEQARFRQESIPSSAQQSARYCALRRVLRERNLT